jgi:hypothetical protein
MLANNFHGIFIAEGGKARKLRKKIGPRQRMDSCRLLLFEKICLECQHEENIFPADSFSVFRSVKEMPMKVSRRGWLVLLAVILSAPGPVLRADEWDAAEKQIQAHELYDLCAVMASREFSGRLTGHAGYTKAAQWAAGKFKEWGLKPIDPAAGYLQAFPSPCSVLESAVLSAVLPAEAEGKEAAATRLHAQLNKDFLPLVFSDSGRLQGAAAVFCGWGISAPEIGYDDYAGIDARGKLVLCFRGTPDREDRRYQVHDEHRSRMRTAKGKGAMGIVYIYEEIQANPNGDVIPGFTPLMISEAFADRLLQADHFTSGQLKKDLQAYKRPLSFPLAARFDYEVKSKLDAAGVGYNVAAWVEGSDPQLRREVVVLGAHFDACGEHLGLLFPGADDNASGSSVVMAAAKAAATLAGKPRRSLLFVLFGGEEKGLQGSTYFAKHMPKFFDKVAAMFNFDMEGEGDRAGAEISAAPEALKNAILRADEKSRTLEKTWVMDPPGVRGSDFAPFFNMGVPCASFWSNGPHIEYHTPGDTIYRINPDILADIARLALRAASLFADL